LAGIIASQLSNSEYKLPDVKGSALMVVRSLCNSDISAMTKGEHLALLACEGSV